MVVSGDRSLYRRRGCLHVGDDRAFTLTSSSASLSWLPPVSVAPMTNEDLPLVRACQRHEPVRLLRPPGDYEYARRSRTVMCRPAEFFAVQRWPLRPLSPRHESRRGQT
jgi:hypothetical protein